MNGPTVTPRMFGAELFGPRLRMVLARLVAGMVVAAVMLLLLEGFLRLAWRFADSGGASANRDVGDPLARALELPQGVAGSIDGTLRYNVVSDILTTPDRHLLFRVRPNPSGQRVFCYEGIDEHGFRNEGRPADSAAILLLGDSCAFGWGICDFDKTIGAQLEQRLIKGGMSSPTVFNLAQPGYSSTQALLLFRRWFPKLRPSYVVLYLGWNDRWLTRGLTDAQALWLMPVLTSRWARAMTTSAIYRTLEWMVGTRRARVHDVGLGDRALSHHRVPLEESLANFRAMIDESRNGGATVLVVNHPHASNFSRAKGTEQFAAALETAFRSDAVFAALPEMSAEGPGARRYFQSDGLHPNEAGAGYIAQALADVILRRPRTGYRDQQ